MKVGYSVTLAITERWPKPGVSRLAKQYIWEPGFRPQHAEKRELSRDRTWWVSCM